MWWHFVCALVLGAQAARPISLAVVQLGTPSDPQTRIAAAREYTQKAAQAGADVVVFPQNWMGDASHKEEFARMASDNKVSLTFTFAANTHTSATLFDSRGSAILSYSKLLGTESSPTAGLDIPVAMLTTTDGQKVGVGITLGTDRLFMEVQRVLMVKGAEVVLNPVMGTLSTYDARVLQTRSNENVFNLVTANYASSSGGFGNGNSAVDSYCGARHSSANVANFLPEPHAHCPQSVVAGSNETLLMFQFDLDDMRQYRNEITILGDVERRPFTYQSLCYKPKQPIAQLQTPPVTAPFNFTVALLQMTAIHVAGQDPVPAHMDRATEFCRKASQLGADIAVFPEMWSVGYGANEPKQGNNTSDAQYLWMSYAQPVDGPYIKHFRSLAQELNMAIAAAFLEDISTPTETRPPRNSVAMIDRHGEVLYSYAKVHTVLNSGTEVMCTAGRNWFAVPLDTSKGKVIVGSQICFDREHPESSRCNMAAGVEVIIAPTACGIYDALLDRWSTRALENVLGVAQANYANLNGRSSAYDYLGRAVVVAPQNQDQGVFIAAFDITSLREFRMTTRAKALVSPALHPEICSLPKVVGFRPPFPGPGYTYYVRTESAI